MQIMGINDIIVSKIASILRIIDLRVNWEAEIYSPFC